MIKITKALSDNIKLQKSSYLYDNYSKDINDYIFFDIETTGFSYKNSMCYLIGVVYASKVDNSHTDNKTYYSNTYTWSYTQWFAASPSDEKDILLDFIDFIKNYKYIISFNGERFDIPFINGRCELLNISSGLTDTANTSIDIFHLIRPLKNILRLDNYKQKTIEEFFGLHRTDSYDGGELIKCYKQYVISKDDSLLELMLLHNHDDIAGLINIVPVLNYIDILNCNYSVSDIQHSEYTDYNGTPASELIFTLTLPHAVTTPVKIIKEPFSIYIKDDTVTIRAEIFTDRLKYFYSNYKDYYYVPQEDQAIHKSVSSFIDKNYRQPAKASNCYVYKAGRFLMQYKQIITPSFKKAYEDNFCFFEINDSFLKSHDMVIKYINDVITNIL